MGADAENKSVRVLLISDCESSRNEIEQKLLNTKGLFCHIWHCSGLTESMSALKDINPDVDAVLVDLNLISTGRPRDVFRRMGASVDSVPIIVFNGSVEHDLALFLIEEGAADTITKDQADSDPYRLRYIIENAMIRRKILQKTQCAYKKEIAEIKEREKVNLKTANGNGARALKKSEEESAEKIREKDQVIHWMSGGYSIEK